MTMYGTSHFIHKQAAYNYYKAYGYTIQDVNEKIIKEEISISKPIVEANEQLFVDNEGRYFIQQD